MKNIFVAITGGPSGGKTTLIDTLKKTFGKKIVIAPEAATILYSGGFPRITTSLGRVHIQRAIYAIQKELEAIAAEVELEPGGIDGDRRLIVCDRGSLDGVAYWPEVKESFFQSLDTDEATEISRYDWVIHLDTAERKFYDLHNPIRTENFDEAMLLNGKIEEAWRAHPQRFIIQSNQDFISKIKVSTRILQKILTGETFCEIKEKVEQ